MSAAQMVIVQVYKNKLCFGVCTGSLFTTDSAVGNSCSPQRSDFAPDVQYRSRRKEKEHQRADSCTFRRHFGNTQPRHTRNLVARARITRRDDCTVVSLSRCRYFEKSVLRKEKRKCSVAHAFRGLFLQTSINRLWLRSLIKNS